MYVCTCVWYPKLLRVRDSWGQPETNYSACKQSGRLGINAAATTIKAAVFFGDEGICHVAILILGDKRQDPGILRIIIEISQTMTFKINGGLCPMMFLMRSFVASLVHNTISSLLLVFAIHCMCFLMFLVYLSLIFNGNFYILLHVVSMNHEVDSTASTPTSGRLVDLGVWVSQKISQGFDSMLTSCWILLDTRKSGPLSNMELHCFGNQVINVSWTSSPSCKLVNGPLQTEEPILAGSNYILCYCAGSDSGRCGGLFQLGLQLVNMWRPMPKMSVCIRTIISCIFMYIYIYNITYYMYVEVSTLTSFCCLLMIGVMLVDM